MLFRSPYLQLIASPLMELIDRGIIRFVAVGASNNVLLLPVTRIPWSAQDEVAQLNQFDIGIMPLPDSPFERGKCGYKLIQYMACSKPVVASPVGVNTQIVEPGIIGLLASTPDEWREAILTLSKDASLRRRMGEAGRQKVARNYSLANSASRLIELLRSAAASR